MTGYKHNCYGTHTFEDGGKYVGEFKDGVRNGQGTYTFENGGKYVGEFKDGVLNGQGTYTFADGGKYVGEFKDGKQNGQGIEYRANGTIISSGQWSDGRPAQSFALDTNRFPFNAHAQTALARPTSAESDRAAA